jgi:hypothetical protein
MLIETVSHGRSFVTGAEVRQPFGAPIAKGV